MTLQQKLPCKSMTEICFDCIVCVGPTLCPRWTRDNASCEARVLFPTPPFPESTRMMCFTPARISDATRHKHTTSQEEPFQGRGSGLTTSQTDNAMTQTNLQQTVPASISSGAAGVVRLATIIDRVSMCKFGRLNICELLTQVFKQLLKESKNPLLACIQVADAHNIIYPHTRYTSTQEPTTHLRFSIELLDWEHESDLEMGFGSRDLRPRPCSLRGDE